MDRPATENSPRARPALRPSRPGPTSIGAALVLLLCACSADPSLPPAVFRRELFSLLDGGRLEVLEAGARGAASIELVTPTVDHARALGTIPAIVLEPPALLRAVLPPDLPPQARLDLALGLHPDAYRSKEPARMRLSVSIDGVVRHDTLRDAGQAIRPSARKWERLELDVGPGQTIELRAERVGELRGAAGSEVRAAFGRLSVSAPVATPRVASSRKRPNLVLVVIDTLRADRLGAYGYGRRTSPNIDALAARGVVFERAYAPSPWTWPSTASLLTGLEPPAHGVLDYESCWLAGELRTLAERLREAGFATAAGSANPLVSASKNFQRGFDEFHEVYRGNAWDTLARVEPWLRARGRERFFLYLHLFEPHAPYEPRPDTDAPWLADLEQPAGWSRDAVGMLLRRKYSGLPIDEQALERKARYASDLYDGEIATVDRAIGVLVDLLTELGVLDETWLVITSDHGEEFLDHGQYGHTKQLHLESLHIPLILRGPGLAPRRIADPVSLTHLPGTLLDRLGVARGDFPAGPDLLDASARGPAGRRPIFAATQKGTWIDPDGIGRQQVLPTYAVREGGELLIWRPEHPKESEGEAFRLYELGSDSHEQHDLADQRPERVRALQRSILEWLAHEGTRRPYAVHGGQDTFEQLRALGYIEDRD